MGIPLIAISCYLVALLAEGVDRNSAVRVAILSCVKSPSSRRAWIEMGKHGASKRASSVALLTEGVDRNSIAVARRITLRVALLTEGVDRNGYPRFHGSFSSESPSSQRAWIEICINDAERKNNKSPSSRRVRIEIRSCPESQRPPGVAFLAEGVDRNGMSERPMAAARCRPPHGGRG